MDDKKHVPFPYGESPYGKGEGAKKLHLGYHKVFVTIWGLTYIPWASTKKMDFGHNIFWVVLSVPPLLQVTLPGMGWKCADANSGPEASISTCLQKEKSIRLMTTPRRLPSSSWLETQITSQDSQSSLP